MRFSQQPGTRALFVLALSVPAHSASEKHQQGSAPTSAKPESTARAIEARKIAALPDQPSRAGAIALELLVSPLVGMAAAFGGGYALGKVECTSFPIEENGIKPQDECSRISSPVGAVVGYSLGMPLTVWGLGRLTDGQGGVGWSFLGGGVALAAFVLPVLQKRRSDYLGSGLAQGLFAAFGMLLVAPIGSVIAYELSDTHNWQQSQLKALNLAPSVSISPDGSSFGISGQF